jgi:tripartite-type tricarboxylate transporter receptor subunit TctC
MALHRRQFVVFAATILGASALPPLVKASAYPARPVRVIVPFATGGPTDLAARLIAQGLSDHFGQQFYVENMAGAGGNVGTTQAAKAPPDGHTILIAAPSFAANPSLFSSVGYDPHKSFEAVTMAATAPTVLTVHPAISARTVKELVELVKAQPGKYSYASPGSGTPPHLLGELFRLSLDLDLVHVPFKSGGQAIGSTVAGQTPISFGALPPALPHVKNGRLRALALTSRTGSPALPGIPTSAEAGYPDIAADIWTAVLVPAGTPKDIVVLLQQEIAAALKNPGIRERMASLGYVTVANSPEQCATQIAAEIAKWGKVIKDAGIRAD